METHCYVCHSPNAAENEGRIAPPMVAIKAHYMENDASKEKFVAEIVAFTTHPTEDKAKLNGAVKRFGVMPSQKFPEGVVEQIAEFMYEYQIEEPSWFNDHWKDKGFGNFVQTGKKVASVDTPKAYEAIGLEYALSTKKILGKNLMGAIQKKGTMHALEFCTIKAIPLTDSMSTKYNETIKRVSDRNRNPINKANIDELAVIEKYKKLVAVNQETKPVVIEKGNKVQFYYPITTNTMCLQCHGTADNIKPEVRTKTLKLYPKDLAVGYFENQVRGIWSITFDKKINN